jgi:transcriptional regulator with AAA-type ATPase domain
VLVIGDRSTGRELINYRLNHYTIWLNRWHGPFISINCANLNDNLLDSDLFGH